MKENEFLKRLIRKSKEIPKPLKEKISKLIKKKSYKRWKEVLRLLYDSHSTKEPKGLGGYMRQVIKKMKQVDGKHLYKIRKIERKSNFGQVKGDDLEQPDDWEDPRVEERIDREVELWQLMIEEEDARQRREVRRRGLIAASKAANKARGIKINKLINSILRNRKPQHFGKKKIKRKSKMSKKVPESLKKKCRKLKVRLTVKRGKKRVYKSVKVLKKQCKTAMKKKKKVVKRKRKFGAARKSHRVVPQMSNGFGRPYFGYVTSSRQSRFGSRRPEFHYPEHVLKGYNTAKTNKKFRFGRPHRHPLRYSHYNPAKTDKKYRFGKSKKIKDDRFRDFKKVPLTKEEIDFVKSNTVGLKNNKEIQKFCLLAAKVGKRDLNTNKILLTEKDKKFLIDHGFPSITLRLMHYCGLNPKTCAARYLGGMVGLGVLGGTIAGVYQNWDEIKRRFRKKTKENIAKDEFINMFNDYSFFLERAYNLGTKSSSLGSEQKTELLGLILRFLEKGGMSKEQIDNLGKDFEDKLLEIFERSFFDGVKRIGHRNAYVITWIIQEIKYGGVSLEMLRKGAVSVLYPGTNSYIHFYFPTW